MFVNLTQSQCNAIHSNSITVNSHNRMNRYFLTVLLASFFSPHLLAATFKMPKEGDSLVDSHSGKPKFIHAKQEDTLIDIAVEHLLGQEEIVLANKKIDRWLPGEGTKVRIPTAHLLPDTPREGIVINLPEFRMYYYVPNRTVKKVPIVKPVTEATKPKADATLPLLLNSTPLPIEPEMQTKTVTLPPTQVISYSVGIGRYDWKTPLGVTSIVAKIKDPVWTPPASIKAEHLAKGDPLQDVYPPGPNNPLGLFALRLALPGYLLHSTNKPQGVGMQVSHGCMRLYPKDIERFFPIVEVGTKVNIINQPVKVGWSNGMLYIESHPNLDGESMSYQQRLDKALTLIEKATTQNPVAINQKLLKNALEQNSGMPVAISSNQIDDEDDNIQPVNDMPTEPASPELPEIPELPDLASSDSDIEFDQPNLILPPTKLPSLSAPAKPLPTPESISLSKKIPTPKLVKPKTVIPAPPTLPKNFAKNITVQKTKEPTHRVFKTSPFPSPEMQ